MPNFKVNYKTQTWLSVDSHSNASVSCIHVTREDGKMGELLLPHEFRLVLTDCTRSVMISKANKNTMRTMVSKIISETEGFLKNPHKKGIRSRILNPNDRSEVHYDSKWRSKFMVSDDEIVFQILKTDSHKYEKVMVELHANYIYTNDLHLLDRNFKGFYDKMELLMDELAKYLDYINNL